MEDLVFLQGEKAFTTSLKVAEVFGKRHDSILRDIRKLAQDIEDVHKIVEMFQESNFIDKYGRQQPMYLMNRDGFTLLAMGFNGQKALQFKLRYINAFNYMEQKITELLTERNSAKWIDARKLSKVDLRKLTDLIKTLLIPQMQEAGCSESSIRYVYKNYVSMIQKLLGIQKGTRDELPADLLYELDKVEQMATIVIKGLLAQGVPYKQIYLETKSTLNNYAQISLFNQRFLKGGD